MGNDPGVNGCVPSTIIAPDGEEVFAHGGAEEVDDDPTLEEELKVVVGAEEDVAEEEVEVVEAGVLMQEHPLDILEGRLEQADAHVGNATEVVARV